MTQTQSSLLAVVIGASLLALIFAVFLARWVLSRGRGTPEMQKISNAIQQGAEAYLARQYKTIGLLSVVVAALLGIGYGYFRHTTANDPVQDPKTFALYVTASFLLGALSSGIAGYVGMWVSIRTNIRVAAAAMSSLNDALQTALRGGAVSGLFTVSMSLLGVGGLFAALSAFAPGDRSAEQWAQQIPFLIVGYGFGASFVALFAQLGGGIYTKAADVGADLVGKVEAGIPEDDPRNAAVIADLVGDNVGDCAGRGADLFESTAAENIGAMILGVALYTFTHNLGWILFPLVVRAFGLIASAIGLLWIRPSVVTEPDKAAGRDPGEIAMKQLNIGYYITCAISVIGVFLGSYLLLGGVDTGAGTIIVTANGGIPGWIWFGFAGTTGIVLSIAFVFITQYYTAGTWRPVREIAAATLTGPATTIITGIAVGFECVALPVLAICAALGLSFFLGSQVRITGLGIPGAINPGGIFGTAVATMGMLMSCAY